jgi:hypothetical protein
VCVCVCVRVCEPMCELPLAASAGAGSRGSQKPHLASSTCSAHGARSHMLVRLCALAHTVGGEAVTKNHTQGTTTNGKQLIKFKTGAFATGRPVQPVLLRFPFRHLNPAYTNCNGLWHFFRHMTQLVNWAEVTVLPMYTPSAAELADSAAYMSNVRALMARELGVPVVEQGLEELHALNKAHIQVAWDGRTVCALLCRRPQLIPRRHTSVRGETKAAASDRELNLLTRSLL